MKRRYLPLLLPILLGACSGNRGTDKMTLIKRSGEDFKILQLTDLQIIDPTQQPYEGRLTEEEATKWADRDACAFNLVRQIVNDTKPDYIVLTGDNVYGQFDGDGSNFKALVSLMEGFKIPWSLTYGNHDGETFTYDKSRNIIDAGLGNDWQDEFLMHNTEYLRYSPGDIPLSNGNYTVKLAQDGKTLMSFSFLDTHGVLGGEPEGLSTAQIEWYESEMNALGTIPNLSFMHIPFLPYQRAMKSLGNETEVGVISRDGTLDEHGNYGANNEEFSVFGNGDIYWDKIKELGVTKGVFVGHAHVNNSSILYDGVRLTFGTKTGIYDYCREDQQGGTLITISDDASFAVRPVLY